MKSFEPAYSQEALAALLSAGAGHRRLALAAIDRLCRFPARKGDMSIAGPDGRTCQLSLINDVVLTYWIDDAAMEIRIITIEWPD
jgi:hypothetical protein